METPNLRMTLLLTALTFTACMAENGPNPTPDETDVVDPYQHSRLCKNQFDALLGAANGSIPIYPLRVEQTSGDVSLANGGFENSAVAIEGVTYNTDPMYVYSGDSSAAITNGGFMAQIGEDAHYATRSLEQLSLWLYSDHDQPIEFEVVTYANMLDEVAGENGQGYSGHSQGADHVVEVEPHRWVQVTLDLQSPELVECLGSLQVTPRSENPAQFYIDAIELKAQAR